MLLPKKTPEECTHDSLTFRSGDYYITCDDCYGWWVRSYPNKDEARPDLANKGPPVCDQKRTK